MSSKTSFSTISPSAMRMIQSVLDDAGYCPGIAQDRRLCNTAALLLMNLFLAGETSPYALAAQLERNFGKSPNYRVPYKAQLPRYAIQGLPSNLRRLDRANTPAQSNAADLLA